MELKILTAKKLKYTIVAAIAVLLCTGLICTMIGSEDLSLKDMFMTSGNSGTSSRLIVLHVRLPRVVLAGMIGAALACAGAALQAILRNPLADPYILGISSGAGLGVIIAAISGISWTILNGPPTAVFAFVGALLSVWLVWSISRLVGRGNVTALILIGVVISSFFSAMIMFLTSISKQQEVYSTVFWLMGNITEQRWGIIFLGSGFVIAGITALFFISGQLNVLSFGDAEARTMGIDPQRVRFITFAVASFITAIAVSFSGLIGFAGLIVPHGVRLALGPDHRSLIPVSAVAGAIFLIISDTIARTIAAPAQLPVGVITSLAGGPFFIFLLIRSLRRQQCLNR